MDKVIQLISSFLIFLGKQFNRIPSWFLILGVLSLMYLSPFLNDNEEQYMQLAKQYVNPDWIDESQNLTETAGTRIVYQLMVGSALQFFSFEIVAFVFKFLLILGFSIVLSKIYKKLSVDNHQIILHLVLFSLIFNQSLFAGEWMFISVEPKTFAYVAILSAFYCLLKSRLFIALIFLVIATYFHVLVGGYAFAYLFMTLFLFRKDNNITLRQLAIGAITYIVILIPFVVYLKTTSLNLSPKVHEVSSSWIYTYFRSPHHTALYNGLQYFLDNHFFGILQTILVLVISVSFHHLLKSRKDLQLLNQFIIVSIVGTLLLVPVAFIDKEGEILKFYLYRINTLSTFFFALSIPVWFYLLVDKEYLKSIKHVLLCICLVFMIKPIIRNAFEFKPSALTLSIDDVSKYIRENTDPKSLIFSYTEPLDLIRKSERSQFSVYKYIPAQLDKIHEWYDKVLEKKAVLNDPSKLQNLVEKYDIDYVLAPVDKELPLQYEMVCQNSDFRLYKTIIEIEANPTGVNQ